MKLSDFDFDLPQKLIAQNPIKDRDNSKLLIYNRKTKKIEDKKFFEIIDYFKEGDVLVRNITKVVPARLIGWKETGMKIEILLVDLISLEKNKVRYKVLASPLRRLHLGGKLIFKDHKLTANIIEKGEDWLILDFLFKGNFFDILNDIGEVPLPKYIHNKISDKERYQTIYAKDGVSAAAPTAGLHFTEEIFDKLKQKGVEILDINLNIGLGTFATIFNEDIEKYKMHQEKFYIPKYTADRINLALKEKRRIIAVGTTVIRSLESSYNEDKKYLEWGEFKTDIFIKPGYEFKVISSIITNFHLPKSSLIILMSAFVGRENILDIYKYAIKNKYRFFSFGDAMFIE